MMLNVVSFEDAIKITQAEFSSCEIGNERRNISECLGRVLADDIVSEENIPSFDRSTVDGYAVLSSDTFGAGESIPSMLSLTGEILMGEEAKDTVLSGECIKISTGGMLPDGADSVVMVEHTEQMIDGTCLIFKAVSPYQNVTRKGDDVKIGQTVINKGTKITSKHIGILCALGITEVQCVRKIKVGINYIVTVRTAIVLKLCCACNIEPNAIKPPCIDFNSASTNHCSGFVIYTTVYSATNNFFKILC